MDGSNDNRQTSTRKSEEQQKEDVMNTYDSTTTESNANARVNSKITPNQPDLGQLSQLVSAFMPLAEKYVDLQKSKFDLYLYSYPNPHRSFLNILSISTNIPLFCSLHVESSEEMYW